MSSKLKSKVEELSESQAWDQINELFGNSLRHPDEIDKVDFISTRAPSLDRALQVGGWARGRIYQLAGKPSSGKTFMAMIAMAEWQSLDPENCCCFIDAEFTYDPTWAAKLGVDNERVLLIKSNDGKAIFEGLLGRPKVNKLNGSVTNIPGVLDMVVSQKSIKYKIPGTSKVVNLNLGKLGVIVLDSVATMTTPAENASEVGKVNMAPLPRFLTQELKKLTPAVAKSNVLFIAINHVKTKLGVLYGNPDTTPGGAAWKHACSVMLMVAPISGADSTLKDSNDEKYGHKIRIKVEKNKFAPPFKVAEFYIDFNKGVARVDEQLFELALMYNVLIKENARTYSFEDEKFTSKELALEFVRNNFDKLNELVREKYMSSDSVLIDGEGKEEEFAEDASELFEELGG